MYNGENSDHEDHSVRQRHVQQQNPKSVEAQDIPSCTAVRSHDSYNANLILSVSLLIRHMKHLVGLTMGKILKQTKKALHGFVLLQTKHIDCRSIFLKNASPKGK